ncbi:MAG: ATP-dependent zinc metalloprotease FtsH [Candidatus Argoarchaeum ethanivorans]|uniref:ATP-dependent zinc metalloprotease FtsH n=1 Tax=Candidatus Argoarchaeum ethanivorans TaxID=2608793 RepID=A0A811T2U5_9EURY|nr:MAG: ATP-dependent zinc metalloprotease FtsH [Candidatus Argoarchaeum ethanivorans]
MTHIDAYKQSKGNAERFEGEGDYTNAIQHYSDALGYLNRMYEFTGEESIKKSITQTKQKIRELRQKGERSIVKEDKKDIGITSEDTWFEIISPKQNSYNWESVKGYENVKRLMETEIMAAYTDTDLYRSYVGDLPRGILLFGPPGTGKTMLASALAKEMEAVLIKTTGSSFAVKEYGGNVERLNQIFNTGIKIHASEKKVLIFIDEINAAFPKRGIDQHEATARLVNHYLARVTSLPEGIMIIGATNIPEMLDDALKRPERTDIIIEMPLPNRNVREEIFKMYLNGKPIGDVDIPKFVDEMENFSGADIRGVCRRAGILALEDRLNGKNAYIDAGYLEKAIEMMKLHKEV